MLVRAYAYIRMHGAEGLRENAQHAVLNANYLRVRLRGTYPVPYDRICMHEFVCEGRVEGSGVRRARHRQAADGLSASTRRRTTSR